MASMIASKRCTGCDRTEKANNYYRHPLLDVPVCKLCYKAYHEGEFQVENGNEIFCRWCGEGEGTLCLCDVCPKSFCTGCIQRNFGISEVQRILNLSNRWTCYLCSPQPIIDLSKRNGWIRSAHITKVSSISSQSKVKDQRNIDNSKRSVKNNIVCFDITRGREKIAIPAVNDVDNEPAPLDFVYITRHVPGQDITINNNPESMSCCNCLDNCTNKQTCSCLCLMDGPAYSWEGKLEADKSATGIFECNPRCSCNINICKNRVVGKGPSLRLEVFRCPEIGKGWGVRCKDDISPGMYIADYLGELIPERIADSRGLNYSDEYLFNLDFVGCQRACHTLTDLGMKRGLSAVPIERDMDVSVISESQLRGIIGDDLTDILASSGAIARAHELGRLRQSSTQTNNLPSTLHYSTLQRIVSPSKLPMNLTYCSIIKKNDQSRESKKRSWHEVQYNARLKAWREARSVVSDRAILQTEADFETFTIDAKSFGSVGRFFNHSCEPNMEKGSVFTDNHDPRATRVAFFASELIPAYTELCYDYGYQAGNVDGKHKECLCGMKKCRKVWY